MFWAFNQGKSGAERLYDASDEAKDIGTAVHEMVECHTKGKPIVCPLPDPDMKAQAERAYEGYARWEKHFGIEILHSEIQLVSEQHRFGGTPDAIGILGNELVLIDYKTSNGVYPDYLIQLAAYKHLWEELHPQQPLVGGSHLLRFAKQTGDFSHHYYSGDLAVEWQQFLLFRKAYDLDKLIKARTK